jgi:hypothetical protein
MVNIISALLFFILTFSVLSLIRLGVTFMRALFSTPPKPFEMAKVETITYGLLLSYIITYFIYF